MVATTENIERTKEVRGGQSVLLFREIREVRNWVEKDDEGKVVPKNKTNISRVPLGSVNVLVPPTMGYIPTGRDKKGHTTEELGLQIAVRDGKTSRNTHVVETSKFAEFAGRPTDPVVTIEGEGEKAVEITTQSREILSGIELGGILPPKPKGYKEVRIKKGPKKSRAEREAEKAERRAGANKKGKGGDR